jgi:hypothetical protein
VAAISCAIELGEEVRETEAGLPGEWVAMRTLREMGKGGQPVAVLSVSMVNRQALSNLTASELHSLPGLLSGQLSSLLRPQDKAFVGHEGEWLLLLADVTSMAQPALAASHIHRVFDHPVRLLGGRGVALEVDRHRDVSRSRQRSRRGHPGGAPGAPACKPAANPLPSSIPQCARTGSTGSSCRRNCAKPCARTI